MASHERPCDLVVVGGGVTGCFCALGAARSGKRVALIEHGTHLGREFTNRMRPWIGRAGWPELAGELRELLTIPDCGDADVDGCALPLWTAEELPLFRGALKKRLFAILFDAQVDMLFMCRAVGVMQGESAVQGVMLANKQGLQFLPASMVIDATPGGDLCGLRREDTPAVHRFVVAYAGAIVPETRDVTVPASLGLARNRVRLHAGASSICPVYAEFAFRSRGGNDAEIQARYLVVELTRYLVAHVPEFAGAVLYDVAGESARESDLPHPLASLPAGLKRCSVRLPLDATCGDLANLWEEAGACGAAWAAETQYPAANSHALEYLRTGGDVVPACTFTIGPPMDDPGLNVSLRSVTVSDPEAIPCRDRCEVLIAGGGTAGANTALAVRDKGADTVVLEANSDLGGTQTLGMVASYYHGYKGGYTALQEERLNTFSQYIQPNGKSLRRTIKLLFYDRALPEAGARLMLNCTVCGGFVRENRVLGLLAADADGLFRVEAGVTVDATGDGDAAVLCGAKATFGDPRTGNAQDYSQWSKSKGKGAWSVVATTQDLDVIDQRLLSENLRGLRIAHLKGFDFDFVPMLTVREGRHITGEYTLDLIDILEGRTFDDGIAETQTDWDPHGISSSWLGRLGFLPVHCADFYAQIPYRCCLPKDLSGMLVTAKAISATTDAACFCRMAADVQNLGWAIGLAAAEAARKNGDVRAVDVVALRRELTAIGVLRNDEPDRAKVRGDANARVQRLAGGDADALLDVVVLPSAEALPRLRVAFDSATADRGCIARALAWFGDASGAAILRDTLGERALWEKDRYDDTHPHKDGNPRAGIVDELDDYWRINQLLVLLGIIGDRAATPQVAQVIEKTWAGGPPVRAANLYIAGRIDMQRVPHFDRLLCIAFCVERLACPELIEPMDFLLEREGIGGYVTRQELMAAGPNYHGALAEVCLAAAAARCGSRKGIERLADFLEDVHAILSNFAHSELRAVSGQDPGREAAAWRQWLATHADFAPVPLCGTRPVF